VQLHSSVLQELRRAAFRERCDWDLRLQDLTGADSIAFLLPEIQDSRALARVLQIKARLEMAEGRWQDALETMRLGFQLAKDVAQQPTLINSLVGVAIANVMTEELYHFMAVPGAPNMYWALTSLPQPLIDIRRSMEHEMGLVEQVFPVLRDIETAQHSDDEWQRLLVDSLQRMEDLSGDPKPSEAAYRQLTMTAAIAIAYPASKRALIDDGYPPEKVEAMPVAQVVLLQTARASRYSFQELFKWSYLPYGESQVYMSAAIDRLQEEGYLSGWPSSGRGGLPLGALLLPAISNAAYAPVRLERNLAALRVLEAVRMHAAMHDGQWPTSLSDITEVPVPDNPLDGLPFKYRVEGDTVILEAPAPEGRPPQEGLRLILRKQ
jgi:hypothetical protein